MRLQAAITVLGEERRRVLEARAALALDRDLAAADALHVSQLDAQMAAEVFELTAAIAQLDAGTAPSARVESGPALGLTSGLGARFRPEPPVRACGLVRRVVR